MPPPPGSLALVEIVDEVLSPGDLCMLNVLLQLPLLQFNPNISCPSGPCFHKGFFFIFILTFGI